MMVRGAVVAVVLAAGCGQAPDGTSAGSTDMSSGSGSATGTATGEVSSGTGTSSTGEPTGGTTGGGGWAKFMKFPEREFRGQIFDGAWIASDPCVLKDGATWRMFYTCVAGAAVGGLCEVASADGIAWTPVESIDPMIEGLVARGRPMLGWDENMETCAIRRDGATYSLFYSGYPNLDMNGQRKPAALGVMTSADGVHFVREPDAPVLLPTPGAADGDDIFSLVTAPDGPALDVVYVGWCVDGYHDGLDCALGQAIQLVGATRQMDGTWVKRAEPVFAPQADVPWLQHGVAEPDLVKGPDGKYYLFLTGGLADDEPRVTGVAVGATPFGPWELNPEPVLVQGEPDSFDACGAFAPSVVIDGDAVRMWYLGIDDCGGTCASCNYAECGCEARFTIGYAEASWPLYSG